MSVQTQGAYAGDLSSWMSGLDSSLTMGQLSVPGTHDSGTQKVSPGPYHTQNFSIAQQLQDGIRFLDIRLAKNSAKTAGDPLQVNHANISCDITFGDVLDDCDAFLTANSSEAIFMLVNDASGSATDDTVYQGFQTYLGNSAYQNLFCLSATSTLLPLAQLRGKIVLLRRFFAPAGVDLGLNLQQQSKNFEGVGWPNSYSETFDTTTPDGETSLHIEDQYGTHDTGKKMKAVSAALDKAAGNPADGRLHITFNSIAYYMTHTPYQYAWSAKDAMNPSLQAYFADESAQKPGKARLGFVVLDFYNNETGHLDNSNVSTVIGSNFA
ncbi:1-phosphatidylinositol phosphodiesterase [Andreprevotia sp. IGB-42]|uniref:phosphatidylinositol-specific phospholipase C domain-containing protein n=1 Tax=Andreprevotia sp. IGB-42 TaxID=2497473 RepID=UPI001358934D|nr:phosphatidylinositol-specific phospholipase C domain-containing protein [Andreprevotia sp. IGB-42]KAF0813912.1 1-phosphatidylinositol phosphodiesterase [Andreprevotia sp. IGB-42]